MDDRTKLFSRETADFVDHLIMEYTLKQRGKVYIEYSQIRWAVLGKILENRKNGKKYFSIVRLIKKTIKEERAKGNLLPEEWT